MTNVWCRALTVGKDSPFVPFSPPPQSNMRSVFLQHPKRVFGGQSANLVAISLSCIHWQPWNENSLTLWLRFKTPYEVLFSRAIISSLVASGPGGSLRLPKRGCSGWLAFPLTIVSSSWTADSDAADLLSEVGSGAFLATVGTGLDTFGGLLVRSSVTLV